MPLTRSAPALLSWAAPSARARLARTGAVVAVLPLLALAACGGDDAETSPTPGATPSAAASPTPEGSATPSPTPTPTPEPVEPSDNLDAITVTGDFGDPPEVEVESPWAIDETRAEVLSEGDGEELSADSTAELSYYGVNGRTGEVFDQSFESGEPVTFPLNQVVPGFAKGLDGQQVGSRVLIAMPGEDGYDASGGQPDAGIELGDTLIFVVDVVSVQADGPEGTEVTPEDGLPEVSGALDDPSIEVPDSDPPTELVVQALIQGEGDPVTATDAVTVDYLGVTWEGGETVETSYGAAPETGLLSTLIPGWQQGLVDQPVGSRVLLVVPPELAYPDGRDEPPLEADQTLVYVIDILATQPGQ